MKSRILFLLAGMILVSCVAMADREKNSPFQIVCAPDVQSLQNNIQMLFTTPVREMKSVSAPAKIDGQVCVTVLFKD